MQRDYTVGTHDLCCCYFYFNRSNLSVESKALTTRVLLEGKRAVGVEFEQKGTRHVALANKEVSTFYNFIAN